MTADGIINYCRNSSQLDREGIFRINLGVRKQTFINRYGNIPARVQKLNFPIDKTVKNRYNK